MAARQSKTGITVEELKASELYGVLGKSRLEQAALDDSVIKQKLFAAEDDYERDLQMRFQPTRVFSNVWGRQHGVFPAGSMALPQDYDEAKDLSEPAYDYRTNFFDYDSWGELALNYRPIRDIGQVTFGFPGVSPLYTVPLKWIQPDQKFGTIQIVPSSGETLLAIFAAFIFRVIGGARTVPQSIFVDYTVGFNSAVLAANHQDLLEGVRLRTLLLLGGIISTIAAPGGQTSKSLGLDGMTESGTFGGKFGPYSGKITLAIDQEKQVRESWRRREKGVPIAFA